MSDKSSTVKEIAREYFAESIAREGVYSGDDYSITENEDHLAITYDGDEFKVFGTKRLRVEVGKKAKKIKSKKEALPPQIEKVCEVTGKKFTTSKFTPYVTVSPEGRKILKEKGEYASERITRTCEVTGKEFETSIFTPYVTVSPEGRKILRKQKREEAKAAEAKAS